MSKLRRCTIAVVGLLMPCAAATQTDIAFAEATPLDAEFSGPVTPHTIHCQASETWKISDETKLRTLQTLLASGLEASFDPMVTRARIRLRGQVYFVDAHGVVLHAGRGHQIGVAKFDEFRRALSPDEMKPVLDMCEDWKRLEPIRREKFDSMTHWMDFGPFLMKDVVQTLSRISGAKMQPGTSARGRVIEVGGRVKIYLLVGGRSERMWCAFFEQHGEGQNVSYKFVAGQTTGADDRAGAGLLLGVWEWDPFDAAKQQFADLNLWQVQRSQHFALVE